MSRGSRDAGRVWVSVVLGTEVRVSGTPGVCSTAESKSLFFHLGVSLIIMSKPFVHFFFNCDTLYTFKWEKEERRERERWRKGGKERRKEGSKTDRLLAPGPKSSQVPT